METDALLGAPLLLLNTLLFLVLLPNPPAPPVAPTEAVWNGSLGVVPTGVIPVSPDQLMRLGSCAMAPLRFPLSTCAAAPAQKQKHLTHQQTT